MACVELVELVTAYFDGALSPRDRARFEAHLAGCPDCTAYVAQFEQTVAAIGGLGAAEAVAPETLDGLLAAFRGGRPPHGPPA